MIRSHAICDSIPSVPGRVRFFSCTTAFVRRLFQQPARAVRSKRTRAFLHKALAGSEGYKWDYQPEYGATKQYVRGVNNPSTA